MTIMEKEMMQMQTDVVVISAGTAGLAAAISAAENGADVIALEKSNHTGGTAIMANGLFAVESRLQKLKQYSLTKDQAFKIYMDFVRLEADARLVKAFIDRSADTIDWLEAMGVEFWDLAAHGHGGLNYTWHLVKGDLKKSRPKDPTVKSAGPGVGNTSTMMRKMTERARQLGVNIMLKTPARKILKQDNRITSVIAEDKDGNTVQIETKAVIIATGGYGGFWPAHPGLEGDGIRMAMEVGACAVDRAVPSQPFESKKKPRVPRATASAVNSCFKQPNLLVNLNGERFIDEELIVTSLFAKNAISRQKDECAFSIFDEDKKNYYVEKGFDFIDGFGIAQLGDPLHKAVGFENEMEKYLESEPDRFFVADSIEELGQKIGINKEQLLKTIEEYNYVCDTGRDQGFGKQAKYLDPIRKPKYYASRISRFPGVGGGNEGIKINYRTEVLNTDLESIPGLYAVGIEAACNIWGEIYPNLLPGVAIGFATNSGRIAGENAVKSFSHQ